MVVTSGIYQEDYVKNIVRIVKDMLEKEGKSLPKGKKARRPMEYKYRPEIDISSKLNAEMTSRYPTAYWNATLGSGAWKS